MAIDTSDGKNELAGCRMGKDYFSNSPLNYGSGELHPILKARGDLVRSIASELVPKIEKKGVCFDGLYVWVMPKYQKMGLSQILFLYHEQMVLK